MFFRIVSATAIIAGRP